MSLTKNLIRISFVFLFLVSSAYSADSIKVKDAWSPEAPPVAKVMAGYMKINNPTNKDIKIKSIKSDLFNRVEIHLTEMKNGMMSMVKQNNLNIKAKSQVELKPGGLHMMLIGRKQPVIKGSVITVTLTFDNGEKTNIDLIVKDEAQTEQHHHHNHH